MGDVLLLKVKVYGDRTVCSKMRKKFFGDYLHGSSKKNAGANAGAESGESENILLEDSFPPWATKILEKFREVRGGGGDKACRLMWDGSLLPEDGNSDGLGVGILLLCENGSRFYGSKIVSLIKTKLRNDGQIFGVFENAIEDLETSIYNNC